MVSDGKQAIISGVGNGAGISDFKQFFRMGSAAIEGSEVSKMLIPFGFVIPTSKN